jgi:hypothetical protein
MNDSPPPNEPDDETAFDLRARAELALAYEPGQPPAYLFRHTPWFARRAVRGLGAALLVAGSAAITVLALRPPELVRDSIEHEYYERTLRGNFMDPAPLLTQLGLSPNQVVPGFPQLMRPCEIEGRLVYHLTTFFERGGMVTVFAFDQSVALKNGSGWWNNVYWQVVRSRDGKPLVLIAQQKKALALARASLAKSPT